jgi:hypothetical protein
VTNLELGWEELISSKLGEIVTTLANRIIQGLETKTLIKSWMGCHHTNVWRMEK